MLLVSSGTAISLYYLVYLGMIVMLEDIIPRVPDSMMVNSCQLALSSMYLLAFPLSTAIMMKSCDFQCSSLKMFSVPACTRSVKSFMLISGFYARHLLEASEDLGLSTLSPRNKNCLLRLETETSSLSVKMIYPLGPQPRPIRAHAFRYSQPRAPAPTMKVFVSRSFY